MLLKRLAFHEGIAEPVHDCFLFVRQAARILWIDRWKEMIAHRVRLSADGHCIILVIHLIQKAQIIHFLIRVPGDKLTLDLELHNSDGFADLGQTFHVGSIEGILLGRDGLKIGTGIVTVSL